jgi:hypothetical protein
MHGETSNERWQELVDLREEFEHGDAILPTRISAIDGRRLEASPEAIRFAEALAFNAGWSGISEARRRSSRRHDDLAA